MEIRHLRYFVAVAQSGGFARAGNILHVTQPALSRQIRDLEEELQVTLFDRTKHGASLTPAGESFLEDTKQVLAHIEQAQIRASNIQANRSDRLTIAVVEPFSSHDIFTHSIQNFQSKFPSLQLWLAFIHGGAQTESIEGVINGWITMAFTRSEPQYNPALRVTRILTTKLVAALPSAWISTGNPPQRLSDLSDRDFFWFPRSLNPKHYDAVMRACQNGGLKRKVVTEETYSARMSLVASGLGFTFVPANNCPFKPEGVSLAPLEDLNVRSAVDLVYRRDNHHPALKDFIQIVLKRKSLHM